MGASNALAAYRLYAGKVPPTSLNVLAYMAAVSMDKDHEPSWWEGHEILAIRVLGRSEPITKTDRRAVERAITPLFAAGAITTTRHSSGHAEFSRTVRYRLWLTEPAPDGNRRPRGAKHPTETIGHKASTRRKVVSAPDGNHRTKEEKEELKQERDDSHTAFELTDVEGARRPSGQDRIDLQAAEHKRQLDQRLAAYTARSGGEIAEAEP